MLISNQIQTVSILCCTVIGMWFASPALADAPESTSGQQAIERTRPAVNLNMAITNLDLCTLAYQLYHQSLCLPLDPWYDVMSRVGSDRRTNICRLTQEYAAGLSPVAPKLNSWDGANGVRQFAQPKVDEGFYSGPSAARFGTRSNLNLDPILTNYRRIDAKLPAFTGDGERFMSVFAPTSITNNLKTIEGIRYKTPPSGSFPYNDVERFQIRDYPSGEDHLIVFEGGTGSTTDTDNPNIGITGEPSWSLMGFVLVHKTPTGHDAHIVFRGSRSGSSLGKTVWKAQDVLGDSKGNPDWITDLHGNKQIEQPSISKVGKVTQGFAQSLPSMLGPITACCKYLEQRYGAPEHIYVTGHSLGAGLGSQFVSAVLQGSYGDALRQEVRSWPWDNITLVAFAQPIPGDPTWAAQFDKISPSSQHYWVDGDAVVEATSNRLVGMAIDQGEHAGVQTKLSKPANCNDNPHEVFVIRAALVRDMSTENAQKSQQLGQENTWGYYSNFLKMIAGQPDSYAFQGAPNPNFVTGANLRQILQESNFAAEMENWLEAVYAPMIADKSSYIGLKMQSTLDKRKKLVLEIVDRMKKPATDNAQELENLVNDSKLLDGNLGLTNEEKWIFCGLILARFQNTTLTIDDLLTKPEIKECLESKFI